MGARAGDGGSSLGGSSDKSKGVRGWGCWGARDETWPYLEYRAAGLADRLNVGVR